MGGICEKRSVSCRHWTDPLPEVYQFLLHRQSANSLLRNGGLPASDLVTDRAEIPKRWATRQDLFSRNRAWEAGRISGDKGISQQLFAKRFGVRRGID